MRVLPALLLVSALLPVPAWPDQAEDAEARTFAVQVRPDAGDISEALQRGFFYRWVVAQTDGMHLVVDPAATGDVEVRVEVLPASEPLRRLLADLPIELRDDAIVFDGTLYDDQDVALSLRIPGTEKPTYAVVGRRTTKVTLLANLVLGLAAGTNILDLPSEADYILWEHRWSQRSGRWQVSDDGVATDPGERDDPGMREAAYAALETIGRPHVTLRVPAERAGGPDLARLADSLEEAVATMAPRAGVTVDAPFEVIVETDFLAQAIHLGRVGRALLDGRGRLHVVVHPDDVDAYRHGLARALLRRASVELPPWFEDGAALWLSRDWYGRPYEAWLPDLAYGRVLPTADELLSELRQSDASGILWPVAAAAVVERLPGKTLIGRLSEPLRETRLAGILERLESAALRRAGLSGPDSGTKPPAASFHRGVSLAMPPGNIEAGYHAPGVDEKLRYLRDLGVDSVSLMPFAMQNSHARPRMRFNHGGDPTEESDAGLVHLARRAHDLGIRVLWKPHIHCPEWSGEIAMTSADDWDSWWRAYRTYVLHHAVLARLSGSELFAVGVELGKTVDREDDWRHLIRAVRRIYPGRLTYAGNWWGDYDRVRFWDALDAVGVDAYYPLADRLEASRAELEAGARRAVEQLAAAAERFGKPVLLTEVGFAARQGAWMAPHEGGGNLSEDHQAVAYEVLFQALGRPSWLEGLFLWKVFSQSAQTQGTPASFTFLRRPAEAVVRSYFASEPGAEP